MVGPSFSGKTYLIVKKYKFIKIRSPEQYEEPKTTDDVRNFAENKGGIVTFDDMLDSNQKAIDPFSTS